MKAHEVLKRAAELSETGRPYVMASVMNGTPDGAVRTGLKVLVEADGTFYGSFGEEWVADVVREEAGNALRDGQARVVVITRHDGSDGTDVVVDPSPAQRGRGVEVYLDPELPAPTLVLFGNAPVSHSLAGMAAAAGYRVLAVGLEEADQHPDVEVVEELEAGTAEGSPGLFAVVGTTGEWDAEAARQALEAGAEYVGLVATGSQAEEVRGKLEEEGVDFGDRLVHPAGLEVGARAPEETAVSILAELVRRRRGAGPDQPEELPARPEAPEEPGEPEPSAKAAVEKLVDDADAEDATEAEEEAGDEPGVAADEEATSAEAPAEPEEPAEPQAEEDAPEEEEDEEEEEEQEDEGKDEEGQQAVEVPEAGPPDEDEEPEIDHEAVEQGMMDPVCGLDLSDKETYMLTYDHTTYHFCCNACRKKFEEVPHEFIPGAEEE